MNASCKIFYLRIRLRVCLYEISTNENIYNMYQGHVDFYLRTIMCYVLNNSYWLLGNTNNIVISPIWNATKKEG